MEKEKVIKIMKDKINAGWDFDKIYSHLLVLDDMEKYDTKNNSKIIKKENSHEHKNSSACTVWEYEYPSKESSMATALIDGRYPEKGFVVNDLCDEIFYVISGTGKVETESENFFVSEGDVIFLQRGHKYATNGTKLKVVIVNAPKWRLDQHKQIN